MDRSSAIALVLVAGALPIGGCGNSNKDTTTTVNRGQNEREYRVPGDAMAPTYIDGDTVVVDQSPFDPKRGDVVIFNPPIGADANRCGVSAADDESCPQPTTARTSTRFIKRIVAVPGDTVSIRGGHPIVNGKQPEEKFIKPCGTVGPPCDLPRAITIKPNLYFVLGDNRGASDDSRYWGPIQGEWILGKVTGRH
jgi:signal peptidase I